MHTPRLVVVVGDPGSGKDFVIQAVGDLGAQHAEIVPKHTSRNRRPDDMSEMICADDPEFDLDACDVVYENFDTFYGLETKRIWKGIEEGAFQVAVVSEVGAINTLRSIFGSLLILVYVHSQLTEEEFQQQAEEEDEYVRRRLADFRRAFRVYVRNFAAFDHVLIWSGDRENLSDQIFRLFRAYERELV